MLSSKEIFHLRQAADRTPTKLLVIFNALSDVGRYRIFKLLTRHQKMCVTDIAHVFNISVPAASQQLRLMEMSGLVHGQRQGQMICYSVQKNVSLVKRMIKFIDQTD